MRVERTEREGEPHVVDGVFQPAIGTTLDNDVADFVPARRGAQIPYPISNCALPRPNPILSIPQYH